MLDYEIQWYEVRYRANVRCRSVLFGTEEAAVVFIAQNRHKWQFYRLLKVLACSECIDDLTVSGLAIYRASEWNREYKK